MFTGPLFRHRKRFFSSHTTSFSNTDTTYSAILQSCSSVPPPTPIPPAIFPIYKQKIPASYKGNSWIVCLDPHQRSHLCCCGNIFCFALCNSSRICFSWNKGNAQHQCLTISAIYYSRQTIFIADHKICIPHEKL